MNIPTFLVAGAARSGTTGLVEGLRTHPGLFVTQPKEPHYFALHGSTADFRGPGDDATINKVAVTDWDSYVRLYPAGHTFAALGDGSVSTLYYAEQAVPEILRVNPQMRLVVMLREPVERAYSSYLYMRARGFEPCEDFRQALTDEPRRQRENWHHLWHYTAMSHYARDLRLLKEAVGPEQLGVWFYDQLATDYERTVREVLRFLGLPAHPREAQGVPRVNVSGTPRVAKFHSLVLWATRNERLRRSVKSMTSFRLRERVRRTSLRPAEVPETVRRELDGVFDEDLRRVQELVVGPVPAWMPGLDENRQ